MHHTVSNGRVSLFHIIWTFELYLEKIKFLKRMLFKWKNGNHHIQTSDVDDGLTPASSENISRKTFNSKKKGKRNSNIDITFESSM